jgi:hypothetical protein
LAIKTQKRDPRPERASITKTNHDERGLNDFAHLGQAALRHAKERKALVGSMLFGVATNRVLATSIYFALSELFLM